MEFTYNWFSTGFEKCNWFLKWVFFIRISIIPKVWKTSILPTVKKEEKETFFLNHQSLILSKRTKRNQHKFFMKECVSSLPKTWQKFHFLLRTAEWKQSGSGSLDATSLLHILSAEIGLFHRDHSKTRPISIPSYFCLCFTFCLQ